MFDLTIRQIIGQLLAGQIRVPAFQRGFVWDANMVAYLMDSIYKGYPFGSILLWRTKERLNFERKLGPFQLPSADPDFPIDYILDGQQRITSIFGVFQTEIEDVDSEDWTKIYFDYRANPDVQESQFVALNKEDYDSNRHFLLRTFFDTTAYRRATKDFDDQLAQKIDKVQSVFKEARIPIQLLSTEDRTTVAIVFERVNQRGVELDTLQLLSAWTWSEDFDLQRKFEELSTELEPFGFSDVGLDKDLLLRCCAAVLANDAATRALVNLNGAVVRERFQEVVNGLKGAIDFLRDNLNVYSLANLPYPALLIPLSVFFAVPGNAQLRYSDEQRRVLLKWFWRTCFSRRYNSQPIKSLKDDIEQVSNLKINHSSRLGDFSVKIDTEFFKQNIFKINTVITKTFVLLLAQKHPYSFVTGSPITLRDALKDYNRNEFHHIYPRAFLRSTGQNAYDNSCLANFSFLSKSDNNRLGGSAPSQYRSQMPTPTEAILERALCPPSLFDDNYTTFINERSELLETEAGKLLA
ncbi:MAG: hypothetical protein QOC96_1583 [Acidobacteriota bacterium]|jgi:hypothetical protein|nr:hypothetical protein [Acidobacteriota bacterium]